MNDQFVKVGDRWLLAYQGVPVRMKVSRIEANGQILLVEVEPPTDRPWIRTMVSSYTQLLEVGMPDLDLIEDDEPTLPDGRVEDEDG